MKSLMPSLSSLPARQALQLALKEKARRIKLKQSKILTPPTLSPHLGSDETSLVLLEGHPCYDLLHKKARYKVLYGGRGSGKTWSAAEALIRKAAREPIRVLGTREYQNSIRDSVHKVLQDTIERLHYQDWFRLTDKGVWSRAGAEFIFKGLHNNQQSIKSTEGIDICLVEEAQTVSEESWKTLIPTIRKEGSEIWVLFNPENEEDATQRRFVKHPPPNSIVHHINYDQNPHISETLEEERLYDLSLVSLAEDDQERAQAQADYDHVWLGECNKLSNQLILAGKCVQEAFPDDLWKQAPRLLLGADWGFSQDPSALIRSFIFDQTLYIEYEAYGIGVELNELAEFFDSVPESRNWPIKADNSRPETISHVRGAGFVISAADKWPGSVEDGISHLKAFKRIVIHPRCKHTWQEARSYRYKVDRITNEVLPIIIDKNNHCLDAIRYSLDGYIRRKGDLGTWARLGQPA